MDSTTAVIIAYFLDPFFIPAIWAGWTRRSLQTIAIVAGLAGIGREIVVALALPRHGFNVGSILVAALVSIAISYLAVAARNEYQKRKQENAKTTIDQEKDE